MATSRSAALRTSAAEGVRWNAIGTVGTTVITLLQTAVLARFLGPQAFGQMALVGVALIFAQTAGTLGLAPSVVRTSEFHVGELAALFWLQLCSTVLVFLAVAIGAETWASQKPASQLPNLLVAAAAVMLITVIGAIHRALAQRDLRFRFLVILDTGRALATAFVSIVSAVFFQQGVWSFVWGTLGGAIFCSAALLAKGGYARQVLGEIPRISHLERHVIFGLNVTGSQLINNASSQLDRIIIGGVLGTAALGYYSMALDLITLPLRKINPVITSVALPVFAKFKRDIPRITAAYLRTLGLLVQVAAPLLFGLAAIAPVLIPLYLGAGWESVIPLVQVFALYGLSRVVANTGGPVVMALGRTFALMIFGSIGMILQLLVIYLSSLFGNLVLVALALTILHPLLVIGQYIIILRRRLGAFGKRLVKALFPGLLAAGSMFVGLVVLQSWLTPLPGVLRLAVSIVVGACIYLTILYLIEGKKLGENVKLLLSRRPSATQ